MKKVIICSLLAFSSLSLVGCTENNLVFNVEKERVGVEQEGTYGYEDSVIKMDMSEDGAGIQQEKQQHETIVIGLVGDIEQYNYDNIVYSQVSISDILSNRADDVDLLIIDEEHLEMISSNMYLKKIHRLNIPIIFLGSTKGWTPFLPEHLDDPSYDKTYKDYEVETVAKQGISMSLAHEEDVINVQFDAVDYGKNGKLDQEEFERLVSNITLSK